MAMADSKADYQLLCNDDLVFLPGTLDRAIAYLKSSGDAEKVDRIILSGGSARVPGLKEFLNMRHQVPVEVVNPLQKMIYDPGLFAGDDAQNVAPVLTVAIGLALR
jgi:type IV pilus assembly protein PilM